MAEDRQLKLLAEIERWESEYFSIEVTDFERTYHKWLQKGFAQFGEAKQEKILQSIDNFLFHFQAIIQNSRFLEEERKRLILLAQVFDPAIDTISDLKGLSIEQKKYIASQQIAKQRLLSFGQGGIAGMGGLFLLGTDFLAMLMINIRAIQLIALSYGFEVKKPFEMMVALKLLHISSLPKEFQKAYWEALWEEVEQMDGDSLFYEGKEEIIDVAWIAQPIQQMLKAIVIILLRKKLIQGVPLVGIAVGAITNYQFSRKVTEIAERFYQKRTIFENLS